MPGFADLYQQLLTNIRLSGKSESTLSNYGKCIAKMSLHFGCTPLELTDPQINDYLLLLRDTQNPSLSYFKHTVYGLRYVFRLVGREDRAIRLPSIKRLKELPVVMSKAECKVLFKTPKLLKHRILLTLMYSAGLRIAEVCNLKQADIDFDRMQIHIRRGKGDKDRYVPLSKMMARGLQKYYAAENPKTWVFNGKEYGSPLSKRGVQWVMRTTRTASGIEKKITCHTLRHSYATHLLEDGLDIVTIQKLLGHETILTTMIYLHIAQVNPKRAFSPLDTLYENEV